MTEINHNPATFQIGLKVVLKNDKNEMLLLKAVSNNTDWHDTWDIPGGRINVDEINLPFHEIVDREIKEEVGDIIYELRKDPVSLSMHDQGSTTNGRFFILFEATYKSGEIKLCEEHSDHSWFKISTDTVKENFHESLRRLMENYINWNKIN